MNTDSTDWEGVAFIIAGAFVLIAIIAALSFSDIQKNNLEIENKKLELQKLRIEKGINEEAQS